MPDLCINISTEAKVQSQEIVFYNSGEWNAESEKQLLARVQEILKTIRPIGKSFKLSLELNVTDFSLAVFNINKRRNKEIDIPQHRLSIREIEVLGLIMQGFTNQQIAEKLFVSFETIKTHRKHILEKTGAKNTASLIGYYHDTFSDK